MSKKKMKFSELLKSERLRLGITQAQTASLLSVSVSVVPKWERELLTPAEIAQEGALRRLSKIKTPPKKEG